MKVWRHVIINTRCSWLHGDPRGFRSRDHRIHSSGDYRNPPPTGEHAGFFRYHRDRSSEPIQFAQRVRGEVIREFVTKLIRLNHAIVTCSCGAEHLHALCELLVSKAESRREVGKAKQKVSHYLSEFPGSIWAEGGSLEPIRAPSHLRNVREYIRTKQEPSTVVWSDLETENWIRNPGVGLMVIGSDRRPFRVPLA